ncbi:DNA/RNA non-specific endonuclease family protein [Hydrogenophaga sp. RAC07]|uniref:DNA/RNA non-specific endonuclease n=1 Tax=Hydrogenophaga sp. RAC07 TaxID=1842537 RepID=UPI00083DD188|nr:DNA/RNA non-specific endonuclease [Hydrogenophaga sp. RAC07]AOF86360.1 DNA/RNA non-specific endonuclease family protein [Hydrogenophaga sp. RAC07]
MLNSSDAKELVSNARIAGVIADRPLRDEIAAIAASGGWTRFPELNASAKMVAEHLGKAPNAKADERFFDSRAISEAIIHAFGRPVLHIKDGVFEQADSKEIEKLISPHRKKLVAPISSVGRLELMDHDTMEWVGTGWRIDDDLLVTNRHVALVFGAQQGKRFLFRTNTVGRYVRARIDFREEHRVPDFSEFNVAEIVWIAPDVDEAPDMAILKVHKDAGLPKPLSLATKDVEAGEDIAVVGYPARDSRNDAGLMSRIFGDVYDVKRFSPGKVQAVPKGVWHLTHDCTTLGGNSGSAVLGLGSGQVVGLHFGGQFRKTNFAVKASIIRQLLRQRSWVPVSRTELKFGEEAFKEVKRTEADLSGRAGYAADFLGPRVSMPSFTKSSGAGVKGAGSPLHYMHFSIVMSPTRRLPAITAVNIDGALKIKLKRKDTWGYDPRIKKDTQVGHAEFYGPEAFDKGHMVRREDPGWGDTEKEALLGEDDTFVYTNAVPQMPQLNQRAWLSLEDYVLSNAKTQGFKISVFTGPVYRSDDRTYSGIQVPEDFFKVVVAIDVDSGELLVSAYMLSQEGMMPEEGFRYGPFKTYQVPLSKVENEAGLRFSAAVRAADVFAGQVATEAMGSGRFLVIEGPSDIVLRKVK